MSGALSGATTGSFSGAVSTGNLTVTGTGSISGKLSLTSTDSMAMANGTTGQRNGAPSAGDIRYNSTLNVIEYYNATAAAWYLLGKDPTYSRFTSGSSATYTPPAGAVRFEITMQAPGGGGGAVSTNAGTTGTDCSFQGVAGGFTAWTAKGGVGGATASPTTEAAGGTGGVTGTGTEVNRTPGGKGDVALGIITQNRSGYGANSTMGQGGPGKNGTGTGNNATGFGAGGGGGETNATGYGGGGGSGERVDFALTAAQMGATATYTVGGAANGGAAGGNAGGNSSGGLLLIKEYYN